MGAKTKGSMVLMVLVVEERRRFIKYRPRGLRTQKLQYNKVISFFHTLGATRINNFLPQDLISAISFFPPQISQKVVILLIIGADGKNCFE